MKRALCFEAPVFSRKILIGDRLYIVFRNRKGKVLYKGYCEVENNFAHHLVLEKQTEPCEFPNNLLFVKAKDVFYGKHTLKTEEELS